MFWDPSSRTRQPSCATKSFASIFLVIAFLWIQDKRKRQGSDFLLPVVLLAAFAILVLIDITVYGTVSSKIESNAISPGLHVPYNFAFFVGRLLINGYSTPFGWDGSVPFDVPLDLVDTYSVAGTLLCILLLYWCRHDRPLRFSTVWIAATVLPYTVGSGGFYFPRYWYLPSIAGAAIYAQAILWVYGHLTFRPRLQTSLFCLIPILLMVSSIHKMKIFEGRFLANAGNFHLTHRQDYEAAIGYFTRVRSQYDLSYRALNHNLGVAYLARGSELYRQGQIDEAILSVGSAVQINPEYLHELQGLGVNLYKRDLIDQAMQAYEIAIQLAPENSNNHQNLGVILESQNKNEAAIQAYRKSLSLDPDNSSARTNLQTLLYRTGQR